MPTNYPFFTTCRPGLESLLQEEVLRLGADTAKSTAGGVYCSGGLSLLYKLCLWSRLANRVTLPLFKVPADSAASIYQAVFNHPWEKDLDPDCTLLVNFKGLNDQIKNTQFGAQKIKDGIVDRMKRETGRRPSVDRQNPDLRINAQLLKGQLRVSLDLSGQSLNQRAYLKHSGKDLLSPTLAAAFLIRSGWPQLAARGGSFLDCHCRSGILLLEAALMAANSAPGLLRTRFGFESWRRHDQGLWQERKSEAQEQDRQGRETLQLLYGFTPNHAALPYIDSLFKKAGLQSKIELNSGSLSRLERPADAKQGLLALVFPTPADGENESNHIAVLTALGEKLQQDFQHWKVALLSPQPRLARHLNIQAVKKYRFQDREAPSQLLLFEVEQEHFYQRQAEPEQKRQPPALDDDNIEMFCNRLRKNRQTLKKWLNKEGISCFRLYDADIPEYAVAVDIYEDHAHVQEYAPSKKVDPAKAELRFQHIQNVLPECLNIPPENIVYKQRRRQKGKAQYEKLGSWKPAEMIEVREGAARLLINLHDYLDVGLFLDHRPLRRLIAQQAKGKRFLNLFCYTATVSVQAALGGALSSSSVDMSKTYLNWAAKNYRLNNIDERQHQLIQADCLKWLREAKGEYDIILLDPPSFSNSKRMEDVLDIQRDHVSLIKQCMALLTPEGKLYFSNNLRSFKLDTEALGGYRIDNISADTLDADFKRNPKIHQCWLFQK